MRFYSRKLIKPNELNGNDTLFGGQLLKWIDEEAFIYAMSKLGSNKVVTKYMPEIDFVNSAQLHPTPHFKTKADILQSATNF